MDGESAKRQVFISYAANDPDWTADRVTAFAARLDALGVDVHLDTRHRRSRGENLADSEWRTWMDQSMASATHVVCLCSSRYHEACERKESVSGGCGVAFEFARIEAYLYKAKQNNKGRVLALLTEQGVRDYIPNALQDACPRYVLGNVDDEAYLRSHLSGQGVVDGDFSPNASPQDAAPEDAGSIPLDRKTLRHQADHAIKSLEAAGAYWAALQASDTLRTCLGAEQLKSPRAFIDGLYRCEPDRSSDLIAKVMAELRRTFTANLRTFSDPGAEHAVTALVACFLCCACLLINPEAVGSAVTVKLPSIENSDAAGLLASLIALVLVGGRLDLQQGSRDLPVGTGTYRLQKAARNAEHDFERQLFSLVVKKPWTVSAGLKIGPLSHDERAELLEELRDLRGDGIHTQSMCFIIDSEQHPGHDALGVARVIGLPVFHAHADIEARLFGIDGATLVTRLKLLWRDISSHRHVGREDDSP